MLEMMQKFIRLKAKLVWVFVRSCDYQNQIFIAMGLHYKALILVGLGLWVYISLCSIEGACLHITEILRWEASAKYKTDIHVRLRWPMRTNSYYIYHLVLQGPLTCSMYWSIICWKHCIFKFLFCIQMMTVICVILMIRNLKGVERVVERTEKNLVCYYCLPLGLSLGYMYDYSGRQCKFQLMKKLWHI